MKLHFDRPTRVSGTVKTWQRTRSQNMLPHRSGRYYARAWINGKEVWKSLKTKRFSVAQAKLGEFLKDYREKRKGIPRG